MDRGSGNLREHGKRGKVPRREELTLATRITTVRCRMKSEDYLPVKPDRILREKRNRSGTHKKTVH
jgi:hypothetical protein